tara:strand:+ start:381 stop:680 length:300 start_codon:yes stop_codon:yes gene_type:complete
MPKGFTCPTCAAVFGALKAARVPTPVARSISRSDTIRAVDKSAKRQVRKTATRVGINKLGKYLKQANAKGRKKNGSFKKGYDQARIMREAWRLKRKDEK